jgi:AraC-like DNA-binding protein
MLVFRRTFALPGTEAAFLYHDLSTPHFRVTILRSRAVTYDELLLYDGTAVEWGGVDGRPQLHVVLDGHMRLFDRGVHRWLLPGEFALARDMRNLYTRAGGERSLSMAIQWERREERRLPPGLPTGQLSLRDTATLRRIVDRILQNRDPPARLPALVGDILACLSASGLSFEGFREETLGCTIPARVRETALHLGSRLSRLGERPALVDLEMDLGVSRRQVLRQLSEVSSVYGLNGQTWRQMLDRWRMTAASTLASLEGARTEAIATALGYGDPSALCHALQQSGLPTPREIRPLLAKLG